MTRNTTVTETPAQNAHPIEDEHVHVPRHPGVTIEDMHNYLAEIAENIDEDVLHDINQATPEYDALAQSDTTAGVLTNAVWRESIFPALDLELDRELTDDEYERVDLVRFAIRRSHQQHAVHELGMDHNQPKRFLVAVRDEQ